MLADRFASALQDRYLVRRVVGRGGMATVFEAEDLRHHRRVAVKVLHPDLAAAVGAERFLAEIRTTATLQHPHILGLIDSGEATASLEEGQGPSTLLYYVMPFVDGESLRDRLERERQLPVAEAVRIASEVASALDYAHRHGVVHRDVKPENILLQDGSALVADFGIALAVTAAGGERLTRTGVTLGTPQYMAPEQAAGERSIDARTDIFALGAMTYEMLAGEPPFTGSTTQIVFARLLSEPARPVVTLRPSVPRRVEAAVLRALEKLPADRPATAREFALSLAGDGSVAESEPPRARARGRTVAGLLIVGAGALAVGWALGRRTTASGVAARPSRLAIVTPHVGGTGWTAVQRQIAITPDGSTLLYVTVDENGRNILVRQSLDETEPTPISGVRQGTASPIVSTDGRSFIGWVAGERTAYRYPLAGGPGVPLSFVGGYVDHAEWDERGALWFSPREGGGLLRLDAGDSVARPAATRAEEVRFQQLLPEGRAIVMPRATSQSAPIAILDLATGRQTPLLGTPVLEARYAAGHLVFVLPDGTLQAAPFDLKSGKLAGAAVPIGSGVAGSTIGFAQLAVGADGTVAYIAEAPPTLAFVDRAGASRATLPALHNYHGPRFSPDGRRVAVDFNSGDGRDVWIVPSAGGEPTRATFDRDGHDATWSVDGRTITYTSSRSGTEALYRKPPDGTAPAESLFASAKLGFTGMWLRDGSGLVSVANDLRPGSGSDVALVTNGGHGPLEPVVASEFAEAFPALSPDSRWLAYSSDRSGRYEVYVRPVRGGAGDVQVSTGGGTEAVWAPDGRALYYRTLGDSEPRLAEARVRAAPAFAVESRRIVFSMADVVSANPHVNYDIAPDGRTFVMVRRSPATRIVVIQNLPALVKQMQGRAER